MNSLKVTQVAAQSSLSRSINNAQKHYKSLFFLPSFKRSLAVIAGICVTVGFSAVALFPSLEGLATGLLLGAALFLLNFLLDWVISRILLKDPIFVLRRTVALSLYGWILWLFFIIFGVVLGVLFNSVLWWVKLCLFGFAALLTLRCVVFFAVLSAGFARRLAASLLQPLFCILSFAVFWARVNIAPLDYLPFIAVSTALACASAFLFIYLLDRAGNKASRVPSMPLFRAFMLNWVAALNQPLERRFEELGEDEDVEVALLKFEAQKPKAAVIVPLVHPGPFKNVGSSLLPSLLKHAFEKEYGGDACVPLGLLGHELDAASQAQNQKIIDHVLRSAKLHASIDRATPFVRVSEDFVTASCQVFGKTAFLSFTLAPKTTEDLPQELGSIVREEAAKHGLDGVIVVNAHNSLTESTEIEASLDALRKVAADCLEKAVSLPSYAFQVGAASLYPKEFSVKDGMGAGGITAIVVEVAEQKTAYIVIDGNNMVSGLREKILSALNSAGFQESEVFTTDTHAVSAVVVGRRGYHPVGEAMDEATLIGYIKEAALKGSAQLESCRAGFLSTVVPNVRVIGGECLESLTTLLDKTLKRAKQLLIPVFATEGLLLAVLLAVL